LTSTRKLWSANTSGIVGAEINTTTSELRLKTDNTTDGQWTTSGVSLAVNTWHFLAFFLTCTNTGPAGAWRVWAASGTNRPTEATVSVATSPSGNFTGSTSFFIGNAGTGSLAFQGDISRVQAYITSGTTAGAQHPFGLAAHGTVTNAEAEFIYQRFVFPAWLGHALRAPNASTPMASFGSGAVTEAIYWEAYNRPYHRILGNGVGTSILEPTAFNGATFTENRPPVTTKGLTIQPTFPPRR
jgi:hypothetical protein